MPIVFNQDTQNWFWQPAQDIPTTTFTISNNISEPVQVLPQELPQTLAAAPFKPRFGRKKPPRFKPGDKCLWTEWTALGPVVLIEYEAVDWWVEFTEYHDILEELYTSNGPTKKGRWIRETELQKLEYVRPEGDDWI